MGQQAGIDKLTPLEARLVESVERGQPFVPTPAERAQPARIRATVIRAMLLGTKLSVQGRPWQRHVVALTPYGIRIHWPGRVSDAASLLLIQGYLDLRDIALGKSGFLPPLEIRGCLFDERIDLSGAHIQSLCMEHCRFASLRGEGTRFAGSVRIRKCGPPNPAVTTNFGAHDFIGWTTRPDPESQEADRKVAFAAEPSAMGSAGASLAALGDLPDEADVRATCEIMLRAAAIGAGLRIERSSLRARRIRPPTFTRSMRDVSALELSHAHVRDRVELVRSTFVGGVRLVGVEIGDDVWILGGKFLSLANRYALDFQSARIGGQLGVKGDMAADAEAHGRNNAFFPVVVIGQFAAIGMSVGEVWIAGGFFHGHDDDEHGAAPTLNFSKADIKRTFKLGLYHPHYMDLENRRGDRAYVHGELNLIATNIGRNFEIHGVRPGNVKDELGLGPEYDPLFSGDYRAQALFKIGGEALKVDRRMNVTHTTFRAGTDCNPCDDRSSGSAPASATTSAIDIFKATVGTGVNIKSNCVCDGAVRLNSCVIGREAIIGCRIINAPPVHKGAERGVIPWLLDMRESRINGHLKIGRRSEGHEVTIAGGITLESAKVQGGAAFRRLVLDVSGFPIPDGLRKRPNDRERTALNLRDFVCGSDFEVHCLSWKLPPLAPAEAAVLPISGWWICRQWHSLRNTGFFDVQKGSVVTIDLRGFRCGLLSDEFGDGWGLRYRLRLRLASFHVEEVDARSDDHFVSRLRWLNFQNRMQRVCAEPPSNYPDTERPLPWYRPIRWLAWLRAGSWWRECAALWERYHCSHGDDFVRHAYDVFARANGRAGEERAAEEILVEKKNIQATLRLFRVARRAWKPWTRFVFRAVVAILIVFGVYGATLRWNLEFENTSLYGLGVLAAVVFFWPAGLAVLQLIARYFFRYGFSPDRALAVLAGCIIVGSGAVHYARYGGIRSIEDWSSQTGNGTRPLNPDIVLVLEVPYAPIQTHSVARISRPAGELLSFLPAGEPEPTRGGRTRHETKLVFAEPSPCNLDVSSVLYAADVFIPVLDLQQEDRCSIRHDGHEEGEDYTLWRWAKAFYEALGWIVTSLVILVLTGVLRRDLERRISAEGPSEVGG